MIDHERAACLRFTDPMQKLHQAGENIGSWGTHKPGFYKLNLLFEQAEKLRTTGYTHLHNNQLPEAFVRPTPSMPSVRTHSRP